VYENKVQRIMFGLRIDEATGGWRVRRNEELHNVYCSPNVIKMIYSRRIKLTGHAARMGEKRNKMYNFG
jgi:hypothetical protein